jgi:hypothetical protein
VRLNSTFILISKEFQLIRHPGMDCRHPGRMDVIGAHHPWPLGSSNPCRNDGLDGWLKILSKSEHSLNTGSNRTTE